MLVPVATIDFAFRSSRNFDYYAPIRLKFSFTNFYEAVFANIQQLFCLKKRVKVYFTCLGLQTISHILL